MEGKNSVGRLMDISWVATECSTVVTSGSLNENLLISSMVHLVMSAKGKMFQMKSGRYETSGKMSFALFCTLCSGYPISNKVQECRKSHNKVQQCTRKCNNTVFRCISLYFIVFHCVSLYFIVLHCTSLYFMYFIVLHNTSLYFIVLLCTSLYFIVLHCTSLYFIVHSCAFLCICVFIVLTYILWRTGSHCQTLFPFESILSQVH